MLIKAKKHLGQHFLKDKNIARKIIESIKNPHGYHHLLEIGPGTGVLTSFILEKTNLNTTFIEIDADAVEFLHHHYPQLGQRLICGDFLRMDLKKTFSSLPLGIVGNFPYHISSQILFKVLEYREHVMEVVGMFQKEVAERCVAKSGSKAYGILSVLLQAYYHVEYLFTVKASVFLPPPKVSSGVIRLTRNALDPLPCNEKLFFQLVKAAFNQRRKMLRNALASFLVGEVADYDWILKKRAEELRVTEFIMLTNLITNANSREKNSIS